VAIVDTADDLTVSAANALLKILEEPPERAALLLVSNQPARLLPTIRSRCRELRCVALAPDALAAALEAAGLSVPEAEAAALAALAGGSPGAAIDLVAAEGLALYDSILQVIRTVPPVDRRRAVALAEACSGRDSAARFALVLELLRLALSRLALRAAGSPVDAASDTETDVMDRLGQNAAQAKVWAELETELLGRAERARALNLDPAQVILDTFLRIDAAAARALLPAA
jgi:DNA polymerase-3 subunit delta'